MAIKDETSIVDNTKNSRLWLFLDDGEVREDSEVQIKDPRICGYVQNSNGSKRHYVMFDLSLAPFNPMAKIEIESNMKTARMRGNVEPYRFLEVSKDKFESYQKFLKTKNRQYLKGVRP